MKIVFVCQSFSENMGYISNCLPKSLAKLGHEVHVIAPTVQGYFNYPNYKDTYEKFLGPPIVEPCVKEIDGYTLHRLPHKLYGIEAYYKRGLHKKLKTLDPDVVQTFAIESIVTWQVLFSKWRLGFKLFTASHALRSVFPLADQWSKMSVFKRFAWKIKHKWPGQFLTRFVQKVYYQTLDAQEIGIQFYGAHSAKSILESLGVDTDHFTPDSEIKGKLKEKHGFNSSDFVCIYTGRFSEGKNPLILAQAIDILAESHPNIKAYFIGEGPQKEQILSMKNCFTHDFVKFQDLPEFYQLADIGVWPREESTSMLDAMSSGLPIIISNTVTAKERTDGNGLTYIENDPLDLSKQIIKIQSDPEQYEIMSKIGVDRIWNSFSWDNIAKKREAAYLKSLKNGM